MRHYRIGDIQIAVRDLPGMQPLATFEPFAVPPCAPDLCFEIRAYPPTLSPVPPEEAMDLVSEDIVNRLYLHEDKLFKRTAMREGDPRCMWTEITTSDFSHALVYMPEDWLDYSAYGNAFAMEKLLLPFHGMMLHCSLIDWQGQGIAFTAPSQTGKSTQARLWGEHRGAQTINGDRALLRSFPEGIFAYGSPWAGSSEYFVNRRVPLRAIVVLEQAKENRVRPLTHAEALNWFLIGSSLPMWEPTLMEYGMETLDAILSKTPLFMLSCRPDVGAVEALEACLK